MIGFLSGVFINRRLIEKYSINPGKVPFFELIMSAGFYLNFLLSGFCLKFIEYCLFSIFIIVIGYIDIKTKIIPDKIVLYFAVINGLFVVLNLIAFKVPEVSSNLLGIIAASGILFFVSYFSNGSIGGGDIKFAAAAGLFLGWKLSISALFISMIIAGIILSILLIAQKIGKNDMVALGPYLSFGMYFAMLFV